MNHENKIAIPVERIEDALREGAVPGFFGTIRISVHLLPTAAFEIDLLTRKISISDGCPTREISGVIPVNNGRLDRVRMKVAELAEKLTIFCPVTQVEATFQDGEIVRFEVTEVKEPAEPKLRFVPAGKESGESPGAGVVLAHRKPKI